MKKLLLGILLLSSFTSMANIDLDYQVDQKNKILKLNFTDQQKSGVTCSYTLGNKINITRPEVDYFKLMEDQVFDSNIDFLPHIRVGEISFSLSQKPLCYNSEGYSGGTVIFQLSEQDVAGSLIEGDYKLHINPSQAVDINKKAILKVRYNESEVKITLTNLEK